MQAELRPTSEEYLPVGQLSHPVAPLEVEDVPAGHSPQAFSSAAPDAPELLPATQSMQSPALVLPVPGRYFPAVHCGQKLAPSDVPYCPAEHCKQRLTSTPPAVVLNFPIGHILQDVGPPNRPGGHRMQSAASLPPVKSVCLPAMQSIQSVASLLPATSMYLPAAQSMQSVTASLPDESRYLPIAQSMQSDAASLPVTSMYFPASQTMQSVASSLPVTSMYFPAMQLMQLELPALAHSPTGQSMQSFWLCDPKTSVYLPARQSTV